MPLGGVALAPRRMGRAGAGAGAGARARSRKRKKPIIKWGYHKKGNCKCPPYVARAAKKIYLRDKKTGEASWRKTAQEISWQFNLSVTHAGVRKAVGRLKSRKTKETRGCPRKLDADDRKKIRKKLDSENLLGRGPGAPTIHRKLGYGPRRKNQKPDKSVKTVQRYIVKETQNKWCERAHLTVLTPGQKLLRFKWCTRHINFNFRRVDGHGDCYTMKMPTKNSPKRTTKAYSRPQNRHKSHAVKTSDTLKHEGPACKIFAAIAGSGRSGRRKGGLMWSACYAQIPAGPKHKKLSKKAISKARKKKNAKGDREWSMGVAIGIMEEALPKLRAQQYDKRPGGKILLQLDGDGAFTGGLVRQWMRENNIKPFDIPAMAGELAPMELGWAELKRRVEIAANQSKKWRMGAVDTPANRREWRALVMRQLRSIPNSFWCKTVAGLKGRVKRLIANKGEKLGKG